MFIEKLWVRIKGELLALTEDLSATQELRAKAGRLLDRIQERVAGGFPDPTMPSRKDQGTGLTRVKEVPDETRREMAGIEEEWRDIANERDHQKEAGQEGAAPAPNPRRLG